MKISSSICEILSRPLENGNYLRRKRYTCGVASTPSGELPLGDLRTGLISLFRASVLGG